MKNQMLIESASAWSRRIHDSIGEEYLVEVHPISSCPGTWMWHVYSRYGLWFYVDPKKAMDKHRGMGGGERDMGKPEFKALGSTFQFQGEFSLDPYFENFQKIGNDFWATDADELVDEMMSEDADQGSWEKTTKKRTDDNLRSIFG